MAALADAAPHLSLCPRTRTPCSRLWGAARSWFPAGRRWPRRSQTVQSCGSAKDNNTVWLFGKTLSSPLQPSCPALTRLKTTCIQVRRAPPPCCRRRRGRPPWRLNRIPPRTDRWWCCWLQPGSAGHPRTPGKQETLLIGWKNFNRQELPLLGNYLWARAGDCSKVGHQLLFVHSHSCVLREEKKACHATISHQRAQIIKSTFQRWSGFLGQECFHAQNIVSLQFVICFWSQKCWKSKNHSKNSMWQWGDFFFFAKKKTKIKNNRLYLDSEGSLSTVGLQMDLHLRSFPACCDQFVTQFLQSITAIGYQLPDEHLPRLW